MCECSIGTLPRKYMSIFHAMENSLLKADTISNKGKELYLKREGS
jgi:hypothetical protein